jgi:hypothetical protein
MPAGPKPGRDDKEQRSGGAEYSPLGQQSSKCIAAPFFRAWPHLGPASGGRVGQPVRDVCADAERSKHGIAEWSLTTGEKSEVSRVIAMLSQGTKKSRQNGPKTRIIPTRSPDGQTLKVRMLLRLTPRPIVPELRLICRSGASPGSGNFRINPNQPDNTDRNVVIASHMSEK